MICYTLDLVYLCKSTFLPSMSRKLVSLVRRQNVNKVHLLTDLRVNGKRDEFIVVS